MPHSSKPTSRRSAIHSWGAIRSWGRHWFSAALVASLSLVGAGCASALTKDIQAQAANDPKVQLAGLESYAWLGAAGVVNDPGGLWAPRDYDVGAELKLLVDKELRAKGFQESAEPDFVVAMIVVADVKQLEEIKLNRAQDMADFVVVGEGGILLEFVDPKTQKTIWAAAAAGETRSDYTNEQSKKRLAYAVKQMFKLLPPKS